MTLSQRVVFQTTAIGTPKWNAAVINVISDFPAVTRANTCEKRPIKMVNKGLVRR